MTYPSSKTLTYDYDAIGNVTAIKEGLQTLVSYQHSGGGSVMKTSYDEPGLTLDYENGGFDRFGRVVDHAWLKDATDVVRIQHSYDHVGNRLYRNDWVHANNSELYSYDGVNQIKSLDRGVLSQNNTVVASPNFTESWNFDGTGNWLQYNRAGSVENRTHNAANEIQGIANHDRNGNMAVMSGLKGKYDAWNRLVETRDSSDALVAKYEYNGLNHRVKKTVDDVVTMSFYNRQWQELDSATVLPSGEGELMSYIWGTRYIDDLVLRERGSEKLYSLADPNWNVVATANAAGAVQERMRYDAFGKVTWMNSTFTTIRYTAPPQFFW